MSEAPAADAEVAAAFGVGEPPAEAADEAAEHETTGDESEGQEPTSFDDLPPETQEEIRRLRRENANLRVKARDAAKKAPPQENGEQPNATPQALRAAKDQGRAEARMEFGVQLASAEVKAALAATLTEEQINDLVEDLNLSRFVTDDGDVDHDAVKHFRDKTVSILGRKPTARPGHGQRQPASTSKTNAELFGEWLSVTQ